MVAVSLFESGSSALIVSVNVGLLSKSKMDELLTVITPEASIENASGIPILPFTIL